MSDVDVNEFLSHFGVAGMKWGVRNKSGSGDKSSSKSSGKKPGRKEKKAQAKAEQAKKVTEFRNSVIKDIGSRSPSELYLVNNKGTKIVMTGKEFVDYANMGMAFNSIVSTGQKINDGR